MAKASRDNMGDAAAATEKPSSVSPAAAMMMMTTTTAAFMGGHARQKSNGTMDMLSEARRRASDEHARAERAERAYLARKRATIARGALRETREHFGAAAAHLRLGLAGLVAVARAAPYLLGERREAWRRRAEARRRARAEEMRARLEEQLAREGGDEEGEEEEKEREVKGGKETRP